MTKDELTALEKSAMHGEHLPVGLKPPEQLLFLSLRRIYADWHADRLTKKAARAEKNEVMNQYSTYADMLETTHRLCGAFCDVTKSTSGLRTAFSLAKSKGADDSELLKIACQIIAISTGDKTF